jgi:lysine-specific demethylase/histidyl-hydroxylase NO66
VSHIVRSLELVFGCSCGANSYWTPAGSQGFAPHYDDVDVFLLQLEGQKHWRLYPPPGPVDVLSRHSSEDYEPSQLPPAPSHSLLMRAGDALYMPRGWVHQGHTDESTHSLHVTFSANQMNSWADLLLRSVAHQIEVFAANDVAWREAVPRDWLASLGAINNRRLRSDVLELPDSGALPRERMERRTALLRRLRGFVSELSAALNDAENIDHAADMYAQDTIARMQPEPMSAAGNQVPPADDVLSRRIAVVHPSAARLILSVPNEAVVVFSAQNSVVCGALGVQKLRFEADFGPAIAAIIEAHPRSVEVARLPMPAFEAEDAAENRRVLAQALASSRAFHLS